MRRQSPAAISSLIAADYEEHSRPHREDKTPIVCEYGTYDQMEPITPTASWFYSFRRVQEDECKKGNYHNLYDPF